MEITVKLNEEEAQNFLNWRTQVATTQNEPSTPRATPTTTPTTQHHKRKRRWTREEMKALRRHYEKFTRSGEKKIRAGKLQTIARRFHRIPEAVCVKAISLGFTNHKKAEA